jgi:hypothetical protein
VDGAFPVSDARGRMGKLTRGSGGDGDKDAASDARVAIRKDRTTGRRSGSEKSDEFYNTPAAARL